MRVASTVETVEKDDLLRCAKTHDDDQCSSKNWVQEGGSVRRVPKERTRMCEAESCQCPS
jgi:hypothetical protein